MKRLLSLLLGLLLLTGCTAAPLSDGDSASDGTYTPDGAADIRAIDVEWVSGKVEVVPYDGDVVTFSETAEKPISQKNALVWHQKNGTLTIEFCKKLAINAVDFSKDLTIYVPRELELHVLEAENVAGTIDVRELSIRELALTNVSGNIVTEDVTVSRQADLENVSGNIDAQLSGDLKTLEVENVSGDSMLRLSDCPGFTLELDKVSGDFHCDLPITGSDDRWVYGDGSLQIEVDIVSSSLTIS